MKEPWNLSGCLTQNTTKAGGAQPVWRDSFKKSVYYQGLDLPEKKIAKKRLNYEIQLLGYT